MTVSGRVALAGAAVISAFAASAWLLGLVVVVTESVPLGLWRATDSSVTRGSTVVFCPPPESRFLAAREAGIVPRGFCPSGLPRFVKTVAAVQGDVVEVVESGILVNGLALPNSRPAAIAPGTPSGPLQPYPGGRYRVYAGEVWLIAAHPQSWDSRYFGPMRLSDVSSPVRPLWTIR